MIKYVFGLSFVWTIYLLSVYFLESLQNRALYQGAYNTYSREENPIAGTHTIDTCVESGACEKFKISTDDEISLDCYMLLRPNPTALVLFFHGNAGSIYSRYEYAKALSKNTNALVLLVDYRGYGYSSGVPTERGLREDAIAALRKANEIAASYNQGEDTEINPLPVILHGRSLGGAVAIDVAYAQAIGDLPTENFSIQAVILENTFTSITDMILVIAEKVLPGVFAGATSDSPSLSSRFFKALILPLFQRVYWNSRQKIAFIECPKWFVVSKNDEIVPPGQSMELYDEAERVKWLTEYDSVGHNDLDYAAGYFVNYANVLKRITNGEF